MTRSKISASLAERLEHARQDEIIDVLVELQPLPQLSTARLGRECMTTLREVFQRESTSVEAAIRRADGEIIDVAWINQTIHARIRVDTVGGLAALGQVFLLDIARVLDASARPTPPSPS